MTAPTPTPTKCILTKRVDIRQWSDAESKFLVIGHIEPGLIVDVFMNTDNAPNPRKAYLCQGVPSLWGDEFSLSDITGELSSVEILVGPYTYHGYKVR